MNRFFSKTKDKTQILPKDLLIRARKVERDEIAKAVASEVEKGRKLPRRIPVSALPSTDMPGFGSAIVTIDGKDYVAQEITFEHRQDNFVTGTLRFMGGLAESRQQRIMRRDENGIRVGAVYFGT